jgi:hypothetical protein
MIGFGLTIQKGPWRETRSDRMRIRNSYNPYGNGTTSLGLGGSLHAGHVSYKAVVGPNTVQDGGMTRPSPSASQKPSVNIGEKKGGIMMSSRGGKKGILGNKEEHLKLVGSTPFGLQPKERGGLKTNESYIDQQHEVDMARQRRIEALEATQERLAGELRRALEMPDMMVDSSDSSEDDFYDAPENPFDDAYEMQASLDARPSTYQRSQMELEQYANAVSSTNPITQIEDIQVPIDPNNAPTKTPKVSFKVPGNFEFNPTIVKNNSDPMNITNMTSVVTKAPTRERDARPKFQGPQGPVKVNGPVAPAPEKEMEIDKVMTKSGEQLAMRKNSRMEKQSNKEALDRKKSKKATMQERKKLGPPETVEEVEEIKPQPLKGAGKRARDDLENLLKKQDSAKRTKLDDGKAAPKEETKKEREKRKAASDAIDWLDKNYNKKKGQVTAKDINLGEKLYAKGLRLEFPEPALKKFKDVLDGAKKKLGDIKVEFESTKALPAPRKKAARSIEAPQTLPAPRERLALPAPRERLALPAPSRPPPRSGKDRSQVTKQKKKK